MADDKDKTDHDLALKRFNVVQDNEKNQRELGVEDIRFAHTEDGQWDDLAKEKRAGRPMYTINRIAGALDQVTGDQRQNRTDIKVRPVSGGADEDRATIFNGLIRNIEAQSKASNAYDSAFDEQIAGGYGGWRVITEFNDDDSFEQDIKIKPIPSATTSLWFDPSAKEYDKRDGNWAFLTTEMQLEDFEEQFPDAEATSFDQNITNLRSCSSWFNRENNTVRVAEYWVKKPITRKIALMSDGRVIDLGEEKAVLDELALEGVTIERQRSVDSFRVEMRKMNGVGFISKAQKWAGKYIPLIPLFGKVTEIEGQTFVRGLVRFAKDPARIYNYETSAKVETTALTPKDPIWITTKQAEGHTDQLETFNTQNHPFMLYNSDPTAPGAPQRGGAPSVQQAMIEQTVQAERDIHATTGIFPAAMGDAPQLLSEKSVISQAQKGERGSFIFSDNLDKSKEYTGEILVDLIPKIYDTARIVRVMNIDGTSEEVQINQQALDDFNQPLIDRQTGEQVIVNDLTAGKYAVDVDTGPAFNTQRQESASQLIELANGNPIFGQVAIDLIAKNLNVLENDELTKRVRRLMIKQGIVDPTEEEAEELGLNQPQQPDPQQTAITDNINMQSEKLISDIEKQDAETLKTRMQAQAETIKTYETLIKAYKTQQEAGIPLGLDEHQIRKDHLALVELGQDGVVLPDQ
jgi:hypothetical protein